MDFTQPWEFGDVTFVVEDKKIYVNKIVLTLYSEVFRAMFTSDFAEKKMTEIPLPDKKFDDFLELMQILHPPHRVCIDDTNVESILQLTHEYQIHHMTGKCEKILVKQPPSIHNLILADKFSLTELRTVCLEYIKNIPLQKFDEDPDIKDIESQSLAEIYRSKLELKEDREPSRQAICDLMLQPPNIENLFLAEKYNIPPAYEKCLKYMRDTPLKKLKAESGFTELKPDTLIEVLKYKVEKLEPLEPLKTLKTEVKKITSWGNLDQQVPCTSTQFAPHNKGAVLNCPDCNKLRFEEICKIINKF